MQLCENVADLEITEIGKLECRPIASSDRSCQIPLEVWDSRIGYTIVRIDENLKSAAILGFSPQVATEELAIADLDGVSLIEVNLTEAQMRGAYLPRANFSLSNLTNANLTGACLWGAIFDLANLRRVSFVDSNLTGAKFEGASLTYAFLERANLTRVNLSKIDWCKGTPGRTETMHGLQAYNAFLCETTLPDGEFIEGPDLFND